MDLEKERIRISKLYEKERSLSKKGYMLIAGVDEAGRGPLAGPVVAGAVILAIDTEIIDLKDSKKISEKKRERVYEDICKKALAYSFDIVEPNYIDKNNILNATLLAMRNAIYKLPIRPEYILVDAEEIPDIDIPQESIIHGDSLSACIAAASIVAKVNRDRIMREYDTLYPDYGFIRNKGYGTKEHIDALKKYGPCPIHRQSFSVKSLENK